MLDLNGLHLVFFHLLAAIAALGGSLFFFVILYPIARNTLDQKNYLRLMARVIRAFHPFLLACYGALILTGAWMLTRYKIDAGVNFFHEYGNLLGIKLALVFVLVLSASYQFFGLGTAIVHYVENESSEDLSGQAQSCLKRLHWISWFNFLLFLGIIYLGLAISRA